MHELHLALLGQTAIQQNGVLVTGFKSSKAMAVLCLAREEGVFAGTSTGLNVVGALQLARELGAGHTVVTVVCDTGLKYLAGDLFAPSEEH